MENRLNEMIIGQEKLRNISLNVANTSLSSPVLTPEILAGICFFLPPFCLQKLRLVCRYFNQLLGSPVDSVTQQIWETSRLEHCSFQQMPPPEGMSEQEYARIVMFENGCQLCGDKTETPTIYWSERIRCCNQCLEKNTVT